MSVHEYAEGVADGNAEMAEEVVRLRDELKRERERGERLRASLQELFDAMIRYSGDQDVPPPNRHIRMMEKAREALGREIESGRSLTADEQLEKLKVAYQQIKVLEQELVAAKMEWGATIGVLRPVLDRANQYAHAARNAGHEEAVEGFCELADRINRVIREADQAREALEST